MKNLKRKRNSIFSEASIRPRKLIDKGKKYILADLEYLHKQEKNFVRVECPACSSAKAKIKYRKFGFTYPQCQNCQTVYMSPRPTVEIIMNFLKVSQNYKYWNKYIFPASEDSRREQIFKPRVDRILDICRRLSVPTNSLVEVGSGHGTFLEELKRRKVFKSVIGIEPSPTWAESCRERGIEIIEQVIEEIPKGTLKANVVVNFEVIEHLFSPRDFVRACFNILDKKGFLILTCPNIKGFDIQILGVLSHTIDAEHINYFHPDSLKYLLESEGFKVIEKQTPGVLDADIVRNKVLEENFDLKNDFLKTVLLDRWEEVGENFQTFLQENLLSSNMLLVAQKL